MPVLQGHKLSFLVLKTCTKNIPVLSPCYGKFSIGLPCSAPHSSCVVWRELLYYLSHIICRKSYRFKHKLQCIHLRCFTFTSINNSPHLFVLPSHHTSTHSPSNIRHLSYRVTTFSAPYSYKHISCLITFLLQLFTPRSHLQICGRKHFASVMETQCVLQSIVQQHLHYNQQQHCLFIYVTLLHVKILLADSEVPSQNCEERL